MKGQNLETQIKTATQKSLQSHISTANQKQQGLGWRCCWEQTWRLWPIMPISVPENDLTNVADVKDLLFAKSQIPSLAFLKVDHFACPQCSKDPVWEQSGGSTILIKWGQVVAIFVQQPSSVLKLSLGYSALGANWVGAVTIRTFEWLTLGRHLGGFWQHSWNA